MEWVKDHLYTNTFYTTEKFNGYQYQRLEKEGFKFSMESGKKILIKKLKNEKENSI